MLWVNRQRRAGPEKKKARGSRGRDVRRKSPGRESRVSLGVLDGLRSMGSNIEATHPRPSAGKAVWTRQPSALKDGGEVRRRSVCAPDTAGAGKKLPDFVSRGRLVVFSGMGINLVAKQGDDPARVRRTRATRPGPGSFRLSSWLGRLGVAGVEPLALALGIHERTAYSHLERLARDGLAVRVRCIDGGGGVAALARGRAGV